MSVFTKEQQAQIDSLTSDKTTTPAGSTGASGKSASTFDRLLNQESGGSQFNEDGSVKTSKKGAIGIAQVMPATGPEAAKLAGLPWDENRYRKDPEYNKALGRAYFEEQLRTFGDERTALAAYNAGPGATARAIARAKREGGDFLAYLPEETRKYVPAIMGGKFSAKPLPNTPEGRAMGGSTAWGQQPRYQDPGFNAAFEREALLDAADESPVSTSVGRGINSVGHNFGLFLDSVTGDSQGAAERIKAKRQWDEQNPAPRSSQGFVEDWQRLAEDDYAGMFATFAKNPGGALNQMVEQTPNSLPALAIQIPVGIASSALYATGVGAPIAMGLQAVASFVGNVLPEGGAIIEERLAKSGINPNDTAAVAKWIAENRGANLEAGIKKAGGISLVDGATGYLAGKLIAGPSIRFAQAEAQVLAKAGVNTTDKAAIAAARATPAYKQAMAAPAQDLLDATTRAQKIVREVGGFSLEAAGEGVGEYAGSYAANGEASVKDAILEGAMGAGTSAAMTGANMALGAAKGPDMDRAALEALAATPVQPTIKPNSPLSNAANIGQAEQANAAQPDAQATADQPAQGSRPSTGGDIGNSLDALLATRDSLNARINGLNNLLSESDPGTPEFQEIRNRAQQATAERDSVMRQIDAASAFGAMNPSASPRPQDSDPLASRVEAVRSFVEDKDLIRALRGDKLRYGPESVNELLSAWARARNPNTSPEIRNRALDDISAFINTFNSRPNFTFVQNREQPPKAPGQQVATINPQAGAVAPATPRDDGRTLNGEVITRPEKMAGANPNQLSAPPVLGLPTEDALIAKRQADADYDQAYQDLVKAEQLGATGAELAEYQRTLLEAERLREELTSQIADADTRAQDAQRRESESRRREVLARVIAEGISGVNPVADVEGRFTAELQRQGYRDTKPTDTEVQSILRAVDMANAREDGPMPSLPNEADFYEPPKAARTHAHQKAEPLPKQQPNRRLTPKEIREYVAASAILNSDTLTLPDGTTIKLKGPQIAAAREAIRKAQPAQAQAKAIESTAVVQEVRPQEVEAQERVPTGELAGEKIDSEWTAFTPETGTLGVPRDDMPQIKAEHRGAMTNFMNARGVGHRAEEVPADSLRPTQAEFSPKKVKRAMEFDGGDRSILVSNDDYVLDGHHQWLAKRESGDEIKIIRLDAPIADLIPLALAFPSSTTTGDTKQGLDSAIKILMDRTDGNGSPDGLIGPENADARASIVAALTGKKPEDVAADPAAKLKTAVPQVERLLYDAAKIPGETIKDRRAAFLDWLDGVQPSKEDASAQAQPKDEGARNDAQQNNRSAEVVQPDDVPANQEPVKNEAPANTGDSADSDASNQEPIKNEASANDGTAADKIGAFDIEIPAKAQQLLADAEDRDIVTAQSVRQMFDSKEGMFDGGLHTPSEADVTAQMKALSVARMGVAAEAKAIGKYEAETAQLIEQAIQYSAVGRTLTKIGARKGAQAPAGVVTAGARYMKSGGEFSGSAAAKLKEARESAAFLEALRRRSLSRHGKVSTKSVTDRLGFAARPAVKNAEPAPLNFTPKQYHEARMKWVAQEYGLSNAEVRQDYDTDAARKEDDDAWVAAVRQAFKEGREIPRSTLDKLEELRPGAFGSFLHDYPDAKVPAGYQTPDARATEKASADAKMDARSDVAQPSDLASIFTGLSSRGLAKSRAKKAAEAHPRAAQIAYVQDNFHDILTELEDKGLVKINCD